MKTEKEKWINSVLSSTADLKKLQAPDTLDRAVFEAIDKAAGESLISMSQFRFGIAATLAIVLLNAAIWGVRKTDKEERTEQGYLESYNLNIY